MRRIALLSLISLLPACASNDGRPTPDMAFGFGSTTVHTPEVDGYTMQRVTGQPDNVPPLSVERGNVWPRNLLARTSDQPMPSPQEHDTQPPAQPAPSRGSSTPPPRGSAADPYLLHPPSGSITVPATAAPTAPVVTTPPPPSQAGRPVVVPGAVPGVTTGGTDHYRTYQTPGTGGSGIIVPGSGNLDTVIGPDGRVTTVPR